MTADPLMLDAAAPGVASDPAADSGLDLAREIPREVPEATVARLPVYLRVLTELAAGGVTRISSGELADLTGVRSTQLRKDLSHLGSYGVRGVGYDVDHLAREISRGLGLTQDWSIVIVGMGNLGRALAQSPSFATDGFHLVGLVDVDPERVGTRIGELTVRGPEALAVVASGAAIGVIATPAGPAQSVADELVATGVRSILNFAPTVIAVPSDVNVRRVDLSTELKVLAFHEQRKASLGETDSDSDSESDSETTP